MAGAGSPEIARGPLLGSPYEHHGEGTPLPLLTAFIRSGSGAARGPVLEETAMNLALAAARRVRRIAIRSLRAFGDTCNAALYAWERSLMVPRSVPPRQVDKAG